MSTLTWEQVAGLALHAGWTREEAVTAVAIARAESGFRTNAVSPTRCCYGIWQVNESHGYSPRLLMDPRVNATAAHGVYSERIQRDGRRWVDWSAYKNGSYRIHMRRARRAVSRPQDVPDGPIAGTGGGGLSSLGRGGSAAVESGIQETEEAVGRAAGAVTGWVGDLIEGLWPVLLRIALAGTGLALIGYGIVQMTGSGKARTHATQAIPTAAAIGGAG